MDAPNFHMQELVVAALEHASSLASGTVTKAAAVVFTLILGMHLIEGAAELAARKPCRFFDGRWYLRLVLVLTLLAGYRSIVVGVGMSQVPRQMLAYTTAWQEVWETEWDSIDALRKNEAENKKLRTAEMEQKNKASTIPGGDSSWWHPIVAAVLWMLDGLVSAIGWILSVVVGIGLCLLMLVQAFWVLGVLLLLVAIGPLCVAFALHPATSSIFWTFFRQIVVYEFLYLPFLGFACSIAGVIMGRVSATFAGSDIQYTDGTNVAVHLLTAVLGPLCSFAVVKGAPAVLERTFGGGDSGHVGGGLADRVGGKLMAAGKGVAIGLLGAGGGDGGGADGGNPDAAAPGGGGGASGGGSSQISGDSARGVA